MRRAPLLSLTVAVAALTIAPAREPDRLVLTFVTLGAGDGC
jgi:hypothetical protein